MATPATKYPHDGIERHHPGRRMSMSDCHTQSLCPVCFRLLDAEYEARGDTVHLCKVCPEHGPFSVPVWKRVPGTPNFEVWRATRRIPAPPQHPATRVHKGCPFDCGLCPDHAQHTCNGIVEVTSRCSTACPVCYAQASADKGGNPSLETIRQMFSALASASGPCNVQISGGEPTEREDLPEIIRMAREFRFGLVQVNTNGLRLGVEPGYAARLKEAGLDSAYLQFDTLEGEACRTLRGKYCIAEKLAAVEVCGKAGLGVVLVCTLVRGVNEGTVGDLLQWAVCQGKHVRGLHFQPAAAFGRFPKGMESEGRITLPELMDLLERQTGGMVRIEDFHAPSCEHPLCSFSATYVRLDGNLTAARAGSCCSASHPLLDNAETSRISRNFTARQWASPRSLPTAQYDDFDRFIADFVTNLFTLSAMAFQDALGLDIERVRGCCIHVVTQAGRLVPFCLYNLTSRDGRSLYRSLPDHEQPLSERLEQA